MTVTVRNSTLNLAKQTQAEMIERFASAFGHGAGAGARIPEDMRFIDWCEGLARDGLEVDGRPFDLDRRPALRVIYETIPATKAEGYGRLFAIMKGAQTGATVMTFLLQIYLTLKYEPLKVGTYYPNQSLAAYTSSSRFLPAVRSVPAAHKALLAANDGTEGNVLTRRLGKSEVLYLWTSGSSITESFPLGAVVADEVQNMSNDQIESIRERMSASDVKFFFACSTAKWPGADIDALYLRGDQRRFHTDCRCDDGVILDEVFPDCIQFNDGHWDADGAPRDYVYCCPACGSWIADPQKGRWAAHAPESRDISFHLPQTLSPTVSPREVLEAYRHTQDHQTFFNKKLGKPWADPSQIPITLAICERQAAAGMRAGVVWKTTASGAVMGLDQMAGFIVAVVLERMRDGRMALIHAEFIYDADPWDRSSALMEQYGVAVCCVEHSPDTNGARRFANRHLGRVFLAGYADLRDDMMVWSDQASRSDRRTAEEDRSRYTVSLNQYKCMQAAFARITEGHCLFPDPAALRQEIVDKGVKRRAALLREVVFHHFTKTALVVEHDKKVRRPRITVQKVGIDPHASYAFMLANVAWARLHGTGMVILPETAKPPGDAGERLAKQLPGLPAKVIAAITDAPAGTCGRCSAFDAAAGLCDERGFSVAAADPACPLFVARAGG